MSNQLYPAIIPEYSKELKLIPGQKRKTGTKYPFKNLKKTEIDMLVIMYDKHNGNLSSLHRDSNNQFGSLPKLSYYKKLYNLDAKLNEFREDLMERYTENKALILGRAKNLVIMQALKMATTKEVTFYDKKKSEMITMEMDPNAKELDVAYKIIKTELGEPSSITKQENINKEEKEKIEEGLNLIKNALTSAHK